MGARPEIAAALLRRRGRPLEEDEDEDDCRAREELRAGSSSPAAMVVEEDAAPAPPSAVDGEEEVEGAEWEGDELEAATASPPPAVSSTRGRDRARLDGRDDGLLASSLDAPGSFPNTICRMLASRAVAASMEGARGRCAAASSSSDPRAPCCFFAGGANADRASPTLSALMMLEDARSLSAAPRACAGAGPVMVMWPGGGAVDIEGAGKEKDESRDPCQPAC